MMLSSEAERLYWLSRQMERVESTARLLDASAALQLDLPPERSAGWAPVLAMFGLEVPFRDIYEGDAMDEANVVDYLLRDPRNPGSIMSSLGQARENLRGNRDKMPRESWEQISFLYRMARQRVDAGVARRHLPDFLQELIQGVQQFNGVLSGTMSHNYSYDFIKLGRYLERADMTSRVVDARGSVLLTDELPSLSPFENIQWVNLLKSLGAYQMYRRYRKSRVTVNGVLSFLLYDGWFPRSLYRCLQEMGGALGRLPETEDLQPRLTALLTWLEHSDATALSQEPGKLHDHLDELRHGLALFHNALAQRYFPAV